MKFLYLLFLFLAGCHTFDYSKVKENVDKSEDIFYKNDSNSRHRLDLFLPRANNNFPFVIFIHGGFWRNQDKTYMRPFTGLYHNIGIAFARKGIGCAVVSYRLFPEANLQGQLDDVDSVIEWSKANSFKYGFKNIYLMGHSSGGHLVTMTGLQNPNKVRGIISLSPILDIAHMRENKDKDFNNELTIPMFGNDSKEYSKYSPITYIDQKSPDILYLFGENDYPFLIAQSKILKEKLAASRAKGEVKVLPFYDHADMVMEINVKGDSITSLVENYVLRMEK